MILNEIDLAIKRLPEWMQDEDRSADAVWSFRTVCEYNKLLDELPAEGQLQRLKSSLEVCAL